MDREVRWERMFPDQLEAAFAEKPVVYFSYGLCEPHGPHNALGLDALKARAIAVATAQAYGGIVAPTDYWHIHELGGYAIWGARYVGEPKRKWLTAVPPWVHFKNVCYQIRMAEEIGFKAAILLTGHYGPNWQDLQDLVALIQPQVRVRLYGLPGFEANHRGFADDGASGGDHAGRVETSLLWALAADCVDLSRIPPRARSGNADMPHFEQTGALPEPREGRDIAEQAPYFAIGANAGEADRRIGERMVHEETAWLGAKADALVADYDGQPRQEPGFPDFESVERFWESVVAPRMADFRSMSNDFGVGGSVPKGSVWFKNWQVPARS